MSEPRSSVRSAWLMLSSACLLLDQDTGAEAPAEVLLPELAGLDHDLRRGSLGEVAHRLLQVLPLAALDSEVRGHVLLRLGYLYLARLDLQGAERTLQGGLDLARTRAAARRVSPLLLTLLARVHLLQQCPDRARQAARQALARGQRDPLTLAHAHLSQAQVHRLLGEKHQCLEEYQLAWHHAPAGPVKAAVQAFRNLAFDRAGLLVPAYPDTALQGTPGEVHWRRSVYQLPSDRRPAAFLELFRQAGVHAPAVLEETLLHPHATGWHAAAGLAPRPRARTRVNLVPSAQPGLVVDGRWISAGANHAAVALLLVLQLSGPVSSEAAMELLYPADDLPRQRRRLRHHLHVIRSLTGDPQAVVTRSGRLSLSSVVDWSWSVPAGTVPLPDFHEDWAEAVRQLASDRSSQASCSCSSMIQGA